MSEGRTLGDGSCPESAGNVRNVQVGYKRTEAGVIPEDWGISTVGEEFRVQLGKMLDAAKNTGASKLYIGNRSVQWGRIDLADIDTVPMTSTDLRRFRLRLGDLLVCEGGEIGRAAIWEEPIRECYFQKALHRLRSIRGYDSYLMMSLLQLWASTGYLTTYVTQTSIAHLPKDKLETVPLPVPTAAEQRAIAAVLCDVDGLIGSLEALIAKKRAIKQAAMQELLTGRTRLPGFGGEWEMTRLGEIASFLKGRGLAKNDLSVAGRRRCVHYGELFTRYNERITSVIHGTDREGAFFYSKRNDVLMPTSDVTPNGLATASCILASDVVIGGDILVIRAPESALNGEFLAYAIKTQRDQVMQLVSGTTVFHLYGRDMAVFNFAMPSLTEQRAIATILSDMDAEIAALEQRLDKTRAIKQGMMQQLLTGAIRLPIPSVDGKADP